jgi:hypothetical protein
VTCHIQPCRPCEVTYILHYLPQGDESSPRGSWAICAPALPEVLTARPFPVPHSLEATTKTEMKRLTDIDVFNRSSDSEWAAPIFIQAKKTGYVRILTDFRRLNAQIRRKPFPLPNISDLKRKLNGFKYARAIDLSMGYYHVPLDLEAQKLCTTILPWGKY